MINILRPAMKKVMLAEKQTLRKNQVKLQKSKAN